MSAADARAGSAAGLPLTRSSVFADGSSPVVLPVAAGAVTDSAGEMCKSENVLVEGSSPVSSREGPSVCLGNEGPVCLAKQDFVPLNADLTFSGVIAGRECSFLLDTGSSMNVLSRSVFDTLSDVPLHPTSTRAKTASQSDLPLAGRISVPLQVAGQTHVVSLFVSDSIDIPCILGLDFLRAVPCVIDLTNRRLVLASEGSVRSVSVDRTTVGSAVLGCDVSLPPGSECFVKGRVHHCDYDGEVLVEPRLEVPGV